MYMDRGVAAGLVYAPNMTASPQEKQDLAAFNLTTFDAMAAELRPLIDKVWRHCESTGNRGRTVTLKIKFFDFEIITRSRSVPTVVSSRDDLENLAVALLQANMPFPKSVRLLGVSLSSLQTQVDDEAVPQLDLPI
jgi:Nucleotidyltransferase/DNA polymerase involved in DNA repair